MTIQEFTPLSSIASFFRLLLRPAVVPIAVLAMLMAGSLTAQAQKSGTSAKRVIQSPALAGIWLDHTGRGAVEIDLCAKFPVTRKTKRKRRVSKTALCGRIVWLKDPLDKRGKPLRDKLNTRKSRRKRPICGLKILGNVKRISKRVYDNGWIYDPEKGKSFDVELRLKSNNLLQVKGYLGIKALNETYMWKRIKEDIDFCKI